MNKPEANIIKPNLFIRHWVDNFTDEDKAVIYKSANRATTFDEITKIISRNFLQCVHC